MSEVRDQKHGWRGTYSSRRNKKLYRKKYHRGILNETDVFTVKRRFSHPLYSNKRRGKRMISG